MRRFYYSDPLAAAWMAKHFGMKFESRRGVEFEPSMPIFNAGSPIEPIREKQFYFIRAESLTLLDPQIGDVVQFGSWSEGQPRQFLVVQLDLAGKAGVPGDFAVADTFEPGWWNWNEVTGKSIIQRGGLAFHWPECEET